MAVGTQFRRVQMRLARWQRWRAFERQILRRQLRPLAAFEPTHLVHLQIVLQVLVDQLLARIQIGELLGFQWRIDWQSVSEVHSVRMIHLIHLVIPHLAVSHLVAYLLLLVMLILWLRMLGLIERSRWLKMYWLHEVRSDRVVVWQIVLSCQKVLYLLRIDRCPVVDRIVLRRCPAIDAGLIGHFIRRLLIRERLSGKQILIGCRLSMLLINRWSEFAHFHCRQLLALVRVRW